MKVTSGVLSSRSGARLLWITALVSLALGIALTLLLVPGSVAADGQDEFTAPIVLEEIRTPPKVVEPPSVREQRQVQGQGASITQSSTTLVSNIGQTVHSSNFSFVADYAQAFTTGSNSSGYTLTSVELNLRSTGTQAVFTVALHQDSSGVPGTSLGTLTTTTTLTSTFNLVQFDASGTGISLTAGTTYWVVIDVSTSSSSTVLRRTTSTDEDSGGATGWSIANTFRWHLSNSAGWGNTDSNPIHIRVNGSGELDRLSQAPRDPIYVTYDGESVEAKAFSAERDTLWDYFESECTRLRSVSDPYRDYSLFDADGRRIQASNGWKWVYVQNSQGDVTGSTPMTVSQCASLKLYQRQAFCDQYANRQGPNEQKICPTYRTW